jgi:hypothetical protein
MNKSKYESNCPINPKRKIRSHWRPLHFKYTQTTLTQKIFLYLDYNLSILYCLMEYYSFFIKSTPPPKETQP